MPTRKRRKSADSRSAGINLGITASRAYPGARHRAGLVAWQLDSRDNRRADPNQEKGRANRPKSSPHFSQSNGKKPLNLA
jgi:hypothetical protein